MHCYVRSFPEHCVVLTQHLRSVLGSGGAHTAPHMVFGSLVVLTQHLRSVLGSLVVLTQHHTWFLALWWCSHSTSDLCWALWWCSHSTTHGFLLSGGAHTAPQICVGLSGGAHTAPHMVFGSLVVLTQHLRSVLGSLVVLTQHHTWCLALCNTVRGRGRTLYILPHGMIL